MALDIRHDAKHPFVINAPDYRITDLGTKFVVRTRQDKLEVGLVEGSARIEATAPDAGAAPVVLKPGDVAIAHAGPGLWRIAVEIENRSTLDARDHETAMDATLASTHVVFQATGATAVSAIDPPTHAAAAIASCRTLGTYPVVVARDTILASPIV